MDFYDLLFARKMSGGGGGGGGGYTINDIAMRNFTGDIVVTAEKIKTYAFTNCNQITSLIAAEATEVEATSINGVTAKLVYLPKCTTFGANQNIGGTDGKLAIPKLESAIPTDGLRNLYSNTVDLGKTPEIGTRGLYQGQGKKVIILRKTDGVVTLASGTTLNLANPCNVYVPSALKSSYEVATNWSGYSQIVWNNLEGSIYEDEDWPVNQ